MRRLCLSALGAFLTAILVAGCGGSDSQSQSTVSKEEIDRAMEKMKKLGPNAHK